VPRIKQAEEDVAQACPSFRVILSAGTRPLKPAGLRLIAEESRKVDLKKNPMERRRHSRFQTREN